MAEAFVIKNFEDIVDGLKKYENKPLNSNDFEDIIQQVRDSKEIGQKLIAVLGDIEHYKELLERLKLSSESNVERLKRKYSSLEQQLQGKLESAHAEQASGKQMTLNEMSAAWKFSKPTIQGRIKELSAHKKIPHYREGRTIYYSMTPEIETILKRESGKRLKFLLREHENQSKHVESQAIQADSAAEAKNFMTLKEMCKKYDLKPFQVNYKLKGNPVEKSGTRPQKYNITSEIEQILLAKGRIRINKPGKEAGFAYDKNLIPVNMDKIDLKSGAYMTTMQISDYFKRIENDVRRRISMQGEDSFRTEYLGKSFKIHYFIDESNKYLFEKMGRGRKVKGADINVYELCGQLNIENEEMFRKMQSLDIKIKHLNHGGTDIPYISLKDSERIKSIYK
jgi:hypothetical protein